MDALADIAGLRGPTPVWPIPPGLAAEAWALEPPDPSEMKWLMRDEAAQLLDRLLVTVARGEGALDLAIGDCLDALLPGDRLLRLGWSRLGDFARERLGIAERTALATAHLARALRVRPLLRAAVRAGEVSARKAQTILPVAVGASEAAWVERARTETVRALAAAVREQGRGAPCGGDERWERIAVELPPEGRQIVEVALDIAGLHLGRTAPLWQRLEAMCQEYLGTTPVDGEDEVPRGPADRLLEAAREGLEHEMQRWTWLEELSRVGPVPAPDDGDGPPLDLGALDARVRALAAMRAGWDELLGHLAMLVRLTGLWRDMGFADFGHYCEERLGMATRTVEQRIWLERRLYELPSLRAAMRAGRVSYEKARLVAGACATGEAVEAWVARAERSTCIALRRELEGEEETQMRARSRVDARVPEPVRVLLSAAVRAVRAREGRWLSPGECLVRVAAHFVVTWAEDAERRWTAASARRERVLARDRGCCQVPGCSRPAAHLHHVTWRSRGGGDDDANLVSLCAAHHLHGVHTGWIRVEGRAPGGLVWELGVGAEVASDAATCAAGIR